MKTIATLLLLVGAVLVSPRAQAQDSEEPADPLASTPPVTRSVYITPEMQEVKAVIDRFGRMWEDEDLGTFDELIARDNDLIVIGTDDAEYIVGFDAFRKAREQQYASYENVEFNIYDQSIKLSQSGDVAWFSETFDLFLIAGNQSVSLEGIRLTGVLEKRDGKWKVVQLHTSVPVQGQAAEY